MAAIDHQERLLSVLQARGIPLGSEDVGWAFKSESTKKDAIAWIDEYLSDATLLTRDELDLYKSISDSSKLELSSASHDVVPLLDRDLREAIAALKSSTSAIEGHAKQLEVQKEALLQLQQSSAISNGVHNGTSKYAQEKSSLDFSIEDLSFTVKEQLKESESETLKALNTVRMQSSERLAADSQVLEALSAISSKALSTNKTAPVNHTELEKWLQALAALRAGQVRAKIDTMLAQAGPISKEALGDEAAELQAELQTLKDEIDSVVHMVIGHELRNPLMKNLEASERGDKEGRQAWSRYLLKTMEYLIAQLDQSSIRIADLRDYSDALLELRTTVAAAEAETKPQEPTAPASLLSPTMPLSAGLDPRSNPSSGPQTPTSLLPSALRKLNIHPTSAPSALDALTNDSHAKLLSQYASTEKAVIDTLGKSLAPQQRDALKVLEQVYATSSYGTIKLADENLEGKLSGLGGRIDELAPKISSGDLR